MRNQHAGGKTFSKAGGAASALRSVKPRMGNRYSEVHVRPRTEAEIQLRQSR